MSVPVKKKRPKPGPKRNFKPEVAQLTNIHACQKALRELVKSGGISDPDPIARIEAGWNPAVELAVLSVKPDLPDPVRTVVLKILLENVSISATDRARLEAGVDSPTQINISIASWAAGAQPKAVDVKPALDVPAIDYVATDSASQAYRGAPPPPHAPEQVPFVEMEMRLDGGGVERPVPIEPVKSDGWRPKRYFYNSDSGLYDVEEVEK